MRTFKNGVWYFVILCTGFLFGLYAPLDWYTIPAMFVTGMVLYNVISKVRSVLKF